jgi:3,4-dihydroxy-2-butanone 4-phosphate synthase
MNILIQENEEKFKENLYSQDPNYQFCSVSEAIKEIREGRMIVLIDDEDRENEGDFVVCSNLINEDHISKMIKFGSGLVYLVIDQALQEKLDLKLLRKTGYAAHDPFHVAFAEPIEAACGVSTGISAKDRLTTIKTACAKTSTKDDIITPGHVLTIVAHPMGLFARNGHTEASHTLVRLAGFEDGYAVGCEVIKDNGEMAKIPDLINIANLLEIKICQIKDIIKYLRN